MYTDFHQILMSDIKEYCSWFICAFKTFQGFISLYNCSVFIKSSAIFVLFVFWIENANLLVNVCLDGSCGQFIFLKTDLTQKSQHQVIIMSREMHTLISKATIYSSSAWYWWQMFHSLQKQNSTQLVQYSEKITQ